MFDPLDFEDYDEESNIVPDKDPSIDYQGAFLKSVYGGVMIPTWKNGKRFRSDRESLTQECCYKSCSHNELIGYCDGTVFYIFLIKYTKKLIYFSINATSGKGGYRGMND